MEMKTWAARGSWMNGRASQGEEEGWMEEVLALEVCVACVCVCVCVWLPASTSQRGSTVLRWSSSKRPLLLVAMTTPTSAPALQCPLKPSGRQSSAWPGSREREREGGREEGTERKEREREKEERKREQKKQRWSLKQPVAFDSCPVCHYLPPFLSLHTNNADTQQHLNTVNSSRTLLSSVSLSCHLHKTISAAFHNIIFIPFKHILCMLPSFSAQF